MPLISKHDGLSAGLVEHGEEFSYGLVGFGDSHGGTSAVCWGKCNGF